jgi:NodT family efflux transporter outer membrane factor (OMF) lipoprotein
MSFTNKAFLNSSLAIAALAMVSGCAELPQESLNRLDQVQLTQPNGATPGKGTQQWPQEQWWLQYNDPQLTALIEEAFVKSPDMAIAKARFEQAQAIAGVTHSASLPQAKADLSVTSAQQSNNYLMPPTMFGYPVLPQGWNGYGQATVGFGWDLDFWGKHKAELAAVTSDLVASRAEQAQARLVIASAIASEYSELARLFNAKDNAQERLSVRHRFDAMLSQRIAQGLELNSSLNDSKTLALQIESELINLQEQIDIARRQIMVLVGAPIERAQSMQRPVMNMHTQIDLPGNLAFELVGRRPDIVAARMQVQAQLKRVDSKKADFYPNINLSGYVGFQSYKLDRLFTTNSHFGSVGPAVSLPLFTAGRLKNELRFSVAQYEQAVASYNKTIEQSLQEVADATTSLQAANDQKQKLQAVLNEKNEILQTLRNRQRVGLSSDMDVLKSQEASLNVKKNLDDMGAKIIMLDIKLKHALGGGYRVDAM